MQGTLPANELAAISEHIVTCVACQSRLRAYKKYRSAAMTIGQAVTGINDCPEYEELSAFVDGTLSHEPRTTIERHLNLCELCWKDVETLQSVRSRASLAPQITVGPGHYAAKRKWTIFGWQQALVAASAAALAVIMFTAHPNIGGNKSGGVKVAVNPVPTPPNVVKTAPNSMGNDAAKPVINTNVPKSVENRVHHRRPVPKPEYVAMLTDGNIEVGKTGTKLSVRADGKGLEAQLASLMERKLKTGKVPSSFKVAQRVDVLRGPVKASYIEKTSPTPDSLTAARPKFEWKAVEGALEYRIEVFKLDGTPVMVADTETTSYQPGENIPAGAYKWVVRARRGKYASWDWSKADMFRILSNRENNLIDTVKVKYPDSHLAIGTVYEHIGLKDMAVKEFESLAAENPNSDLAKKLLAGAKSSK